MSFVFVDTFEQYWVIFVHWNRNESINMMEDSIRRFHWEEKRRMGVPPRFPSEDDLPSSNYLY